MGWWVISSAVWNGVPRCKWEGSLGALRQPRDDKLLLVMTNKTPNRVKKETRQAAQRPTLNDRAQPES